MAVELEPVHLPRLALVPVGAAVDGDPGLDAGVGVVEVGLQDDADAVGFVDDEDIVAIELPFRAAVFGDQQQRKILP